MVSIGMRCLSIPASAGLLALLSGCTSGAGVQAVRSGTVPAGRSYTLVDAARHYGGQDLPVAPIEACLTRAGLGKAADRRGDVLVQIARTQRPARARILTENEPSPQLVRSGKTREALAVAISDSANGEVLFRASADRRMATGRATGATTQDDALVGALCAVILRPGPGEATR